jgi:hypothetical protein
MAASAFTFVDCKLRESTSFYFFAIVDFLFFSFLYSLDDLSTAKDRRFVACGRPLLDWTNGIFRVSTASADPLTCSAKILIAARLLQPSSHQAHATIALFLP